MANSVEAASIAIMVKETASRLLEMLGKNSETNLRRELNRLNGYIDKVSYFSQKRRMVERMWEVSELIEDAVDECCAFPDQSSGLICYLSWPSGRRHSPLKIDSIKALLTDIDQNQYYLVPCLVNDMFFGPYLFSQPSKELFLQAISPLVAALIRNFLVGQAPSYLAVSVLGIGGVDKATFAEVYEDEAVKIHFDFRARIQDPIESVAKQICAADQREVGDIEAMNFVEVVATVKRVLQSKRYFLVFDCDANAELWYVIREALPEDNNGSRVIITTHSYRAVPYHASAELVKNILSNMASTYDLSKPHAVESEEFFDKMVELCERMPLAIMAVASLLLTNKTFPQEWRMLIQNFSFEVEPNENLKCLTKILALGFYDLPHQIKSCLLYFTLFPREALIPNEELFKLWIAEGFIPEESGRSLEEIAQDYLNQLIKRNLVQACEGFYGIGSFFRVHCLMYEFLHHEAAERRFFQKYEIFPGTSFTEKSRRLVISNHGVEIFVGRIAHSRVRTIFLSSLGALNHSIMVRMFKKYKLLTLLDIDNSPLKLLPKEVGDLSCLKHLRLRNTQLRTLPKSVGKLQKLQTLDLTRTLLVELPMEIFMLRNLRHLLASQCDNKISLDPAKGVKMKAGIGYLVNLLTLTVVEAHLSGMDVIQELKELKKLRSLSVSRLTTELSSALCACIYEMSNLESLRLHSMNNELLDLQKIAIPPPKLEHLVLKGLIQKLPNWISRLQNLKVMCLSHSMLADDPLQRFCLLPYLESLWLYRAYEGQRLHFPKGGFPSLKLLVLRDLQGLEAVEIEEGSLPLLEELRIGPSPLLNEVPSGLICLKKLKLVSFYDMPSEFVLRMKPDEGSEYWKVEHIQSILIWFRDEGRRYVSYKLGDDLWRRLEDTDVNGSDIGQCESRLSFSYSDDEEDSAAISNLQLNDMPRPSFSSDRFSFFTDDVEQ